MFTLALLGTSHWNTSVTAVARRVIDKYIYPLFCRFTHRQADTCSHCRFASVRSPVHSAPFLLDRFARPKGTKRPFAGLRCASRSCGRSPQSGTKKQCQRHWILCAYKNGHDKTRRFVPQTVAAFPTLRNVVPLLPTNLLLKAGYCRNIPM